MNKLYIVSALAITSILSVNAQEVRITKENAQEVVHQVMRAGMQTAGIAPTIAPAVGIARTMIASSSAGQMIRPQVIQAFPVTGDPVIDAQVKTLSLEMNAKIKAINDEYMKKIQALVGNRKIVQPIPPKMATGTMEHIWNESRNATTSSTTRGRMMRGEVRGVEVMNTASGTVPVMMPMFMQTQDTNTSGIGAQFGKLFRGIFGGN